MIWYDVSARKPLAIETGDWDGKKSDAILVYTRSRECRVAVMYHAIMDGLESFDFYDDRDCEIKDVRYWSKIDLPL